MKRGKTFGKFTIDYFDKLPVFYQVFEESLKKDGEIYGLPSYIHNPLNNAYVILWNKEIFQKQNLPNLYEIFEKGEWTWNKLLQIARKATKDTNNDGKIDQWGFTDIGTPTLLSLMDTFQAKVTKTTEGNTKFTMKDEKIKY